MRSRSSFNSLFAATLGLAAVGVVVVLFGNARVASAQTSAVAISIDELIYRGLQHNAEGDYDAARAVWNHLANLDPEHPAANVYATETLYWRVVHEEDGTRFYAAIRRECDEAIRKAEAWVGASPGEAYGHFYLGQALMQLGRLHGTQARIFTAWRLGERGRSALEKALELDADLIDAKFPIGLYDYYASLVPDFFNWLSFLWFVPSGHGDRGIAFMEDVARDGTLHRVTAEFHLANVRSEHPKRIDLDSAYAAYRSLHARYPRNAIIHFQLIEVLEMRGAYKDLVVEARVLEAHPGRGRHHRGLADMARVWRARGEMMLHDIDDAWKTLTVFGDDDPENPDWGSRWVKLTRAQLLDLRGERDQALDLYGSVLALDFDSNISRARSIAAHGADQPFRLDGGPPTTKSHESHPPPGFSLPTP